MLRLVSLVLFFQFLVVIVVFGQRQRRDSLPALQPSNIAVFDIDAGLPISCTVNGLIDKKGRLWVNPCYWQDEHKTVDFYQFNGTQSSFVAMENIPKELVDKQAVLSGYTKSGELFGFFRNTGASFFFNPETRESRFYYLDTKGAEIAFMGLTQAFGIITQGFSATQHLVYQLEQDKFQLLLSLPRTDTDNTDPFYSSGSKPILTESELWFSNLGKSRASTNEEAIASFGSVVQFNLATHAVRQYTLNELFGTTPPRPIEPELERRMASGNNGAILLFLRGWDQYLEVNPQSGAVHPVYPFTYLNSVKKRKPVNAIYTLPIIEQDQAGNLLFCFKNGPQYEAVLQDKDGRRYNYAPVLNAALKVSRFDVGTTIHSILGKDFRRQVYVFSSSGLAVVELKLSDPIKVCLEGLATRAITEVSPMQFMVIPEGDWGILTFFPATDTTVRMAAPLVFGDLTSKNVSLRKMANVVKDAQGYFWLPLNKQLVRFREDGAYTNFPVGLDFMKFAFLDAETFLLESGFFVYSYHLPSQKAEPYRVNGQPLKLDGVVNQILLSRDSEIVWIAGLDGLHRIDLATGTHRLIGRAEGFQDARMMCIDEDASGRLWIGTYGGGLHIYNPKSGAVSIVDQKQGLSNNIVVGILADDEGVRWLSTYKGITLVSAEGKVLTRIYKQDGLSTNEFNRYSYVKGSNGQLLFGSVNGINCIDPKAVKAQILDANQLRIYLSSLSYFDVQKDSLISLQYCPFGRGKPLKLAATHRYLNLEFALSSLLRMGENRFAYKIEGPDIEGHQGWIYIGSNSELNLQGLPAGKYDILIRGGDYRGNWTTTPLVIPIEAAEFFYKQTWFVVLCVITLLFLVAGWMYRQKIEQKRLEKELEKRTGEIMRARDQLVVQEKLASLGQLTAGIAHEIKNPLNFVNNFALDSSRLADRLIDHLEKIKDKIDANEYQRMLHYLQEMKQNVLDIRSSGSTADRIVRSMMDHARGTSEKMQLLDLNLLLEENIHLAISGFKAGRPSFLIKVVESFDPQAPKVFGSPLNLARAFLNILNNACYALYEKLQTQAGPFQAELRVQTQVQGDYFTIRIRDNGPGIPPEIIKDIFTPFFTTKPTGTGNTGLGLSICFDIIVKEHAGILEVDSEPGAGTEFMVQLPLVAR